jgi:hypothetical protein
MLQLGIADGEACERPGMASAKPQRKPKEPATPEEVRLRRAFAEFVAEKIEEETDGNQSEFGRQIGVPPGDLNAGMSGPDKESGKNISLRILTKISRKYGPPMPELLIRIATLYNEDSNKALKRLADAALEKSPAKRRRGRASDALKEGKKPSRPGRPPSKPSHPGSRSQSDDRPPSSR